MGFYSFIYFWGVGQFQIQAAPVEPRKNEGDRRPRGGPDAHHAAGFPGRGVLRGTVRPDMSP